MNAEAGSTGADDPAMAELQSVAGGDLGLARAFRDALEDLRDSTDDPGFTALIDEVLVGRRPVRSLASSPAFDRVVGPRLTQVSAHLDGLDPAERARLTAEGEQALANLASETPD